MKFIKLTEKEYRNFWENHPLKTFLSAPEIGHLRKNNGWDLEYVGVKDNKSLVAATMLVSIKRKLGKKEFYSPRGYLIDFNNKELVNYFTEELKKYIKKNNGYVLRIDPYVIYKQRDIDGNTVENGIDNSSVVSNLYRLGFKKVPIKDMEQVGWMFSLDIGEKKEKEILDEMNRMAKTSV